MTTDTALQTLNTLRIRIYALLNRMPISETYAVYQDMMTAGNKFTFRERIAAMQAIVARLEKAS